VELENNSTTIMSLGQARRCDEMRIASLRAALKQTLTRERI